MNATEIDTSRLEDLLNDECKCEAHHEHGEVTCSYRVTHRHKTCKFDKLACFNATLRILGEGHYQNRHLWYCPDCERRLSDCWTIIPV